MLLRTLSGAIALVLALGPCRDCAGCDEAEFGICIEQGGDRIEGFGQDDGDAARRRRVAARIVRAGRAFEEGMPGGDRDRTRYTGEHGGLGKFGVSDSAFIGAIPTGHDASSRSSRGAGAAGISYFG